jgi:hypothetical protein
LDYASANDTMVQKLVQLIKAHYDLDMDKKDLQIRCLAHVVNLIVQALLNGMGEADDPDTVDYFTLDATAPIHYSPEEDEELIQMEGEAAAQADDEAELIDEDDEDVDAYLPKGSPIQKVCLHLSTCSHLISSQLRTIITKICSSPQCRS